MMGCGFPWCIPYTHFPHLYPIPLGHRLAGARPAVYPPFFAARFGWKSWKVGKRIGKKDKAIYRGSLVGWLILASKGILI